MKLSFHLYSKSSVLIEWEETSSLNKKIALLHALQQYYGNQASINCGVSSILIWFKGTVSLDQVIDQVTIIYDRLMVNESETIVWNIPMCTDLDYLELEMLSTILGISKKRILHLHYDTIYTVDLIGFLPGFPYLSGLHPQLQLPRKTTPSSLIKSGTVAIAQHNCGIYPQDSPGGWYGIGACPLRLFDPTRETPVFLNLGDQIQFYEIDYNHYKQLIKHPVSFNNYSNNG